MLNRTRVALLIAATMAAPVGAAVPNYQDLLKSLGPSGVVKPILAASGSPTAAQEIDQLGKILAASSSNAEAVLDALAAEKSLEAATVRENCCGPWQLVSMPGTGPTIRAGNRWSRRESPYWDTTIPSCATSPPGP